MYSTANSSVGVVCFIASMRPLSPARPPDGRTFAMVPSSRVGVGCVEGRRSQSHQPPKSQSHRVRVPVPPSRFGGKYLPFRKSPAPHVPFSDVLDIKTSLNGTCGAGDFRNGRYLPPNLDGGTGTRTRCDWDLGG